MKTDIIKSVCQFTKVPQEKIKPDSHLVDDLGMDSLEIFLLVQSIEEKYGIRFYEEDIFNLFTVGAIEEYVVNHQNTEKP